MATDHHEGDRPMTETRNQPPQNEWQALRRLFNCNKSQLAERLGVTRQTLRIWEAATERGDPPTEQANRAAKRLLAEQLGRFDR